MAPRTTYGTCQQKGHTCGSRCIPCQPMRKGTCMALTIKLGGPKKWSNEETLIPKISCLDLGSKTRVLILAIAIDLAYLGAKSDQRKSNAFAKGWLSIPADRCFSTGSLATS